MYQGFGAQNYGFKPQPAPAMNFMPNYAPQPQHPAAPQNTANVNWIYVNGIEGARNQIVQPGMTSWMMDNNDPTIYVKSVDGMGTATLKAFRLTEIDPNARPAAEQPYVQKSEMDSILSRIKALEDTIGGLNS